MGRIQRATNVMGVTSFSVMIWQLVSEIVTGNFWLSGIDHRARLVAQSKGCQGERRAV